MREYPTNNWDGWVDIYGPAEPRKATVLSTESCFGYRVCIYVQRKSRQGSKQKTPTHPKEQSQAKVQKQRRRTKAIRHRSTRQRRGNLWFPFGASQGETSQARTLRRGVGVGVGIAICLGPVISNREANWWKRSRTRPSGSGIAQVEEAGFVVAAAGGRG